MAPPDQTLYRPSPEGAARAKIAKDRRDAATKLANDVKTRPIRQVPSNLEEQIYDKLPSSYSKGLPHDPYGIVDTSAYDLYRDALTDAKADFEVPLGPVNEAGKYRPTGYSEGGGNVTNFFRQHNGGAPFIVRKWESPLAGHYYSLEGPDADRVAMPPAPKLGSDELIAEMAEVYVMALMRDSDFNAFENGQGNARTYCDMLGKLPWFAGTGTPANAQEQRRRNARFADGKTALSSDVLFRGSTPGSKVGPYLSQFLLWGTKGKGQTRPTAPYDGQIQFGAQTINQRILPQAKDIDYMANWAEWLDVQNGADVGFLQQFESSERLMKNPRDLATYVHFDQLYQAYFNACLIMLENKVPFDAGFPNNGHRTRGAFASFGGPHILSLLTEVASRALKAVRRQKFQVHRRARPEVIAAMMTLAANSQGAKLGSAKGDVEKMVAELDHRGIGLLGQIDAHNRGQTQFAQHRGFAMAHPLVWPSNNQLDCNYLLPMAFPEGSPMHAAYGAGHATVAGACVTILKAFFAMTRDGKPLTMDMVFGADMAAQTVSSSGGFADACGAALADLTLQGELDKLAANISIGRNMAGVHYYTDYYESLRLGERVAVGILQEQMNNYIEPVTMSFTDFDGHKVKVGTSGKVGRNETYLEIDGSDAEVDVAGWWEKNVV
ncbi:MAG: vanadium-dependent haloperoxidase [Rhodospirillales bacterium]|nr:vanadium-dependent haloperoxidase [Rhodospirillales bacterium]